MSEVVEFSGLDEAPEILNPMMRHWNKIASTLYKGEIHVPLIFEDDKGELHGNDWARGFMRGMHMRHDGWAELINDEKYGDSLTPMMMLDHEQDEDPETRPDPITPDKREQVIAFMAAGLMNAYEYFGKSGRAISASMHLNPGATLPRLVGTTHARADRGRSTRMLRRGDCELSMPVQRPGREASI